MKHVVIEVVNHLHRLLHMQQLRLQPNRRTIFPALVAVLVLAMSHPAQAQLGGQAAISGTVTDPTQAVVPNATVTATNVATGVKTQRSTTSSGYYVISPLTPGNYTVTVEAPRFKTASQENVVLDALQNFGLNIVLSIGSSEETISVSAAPPALETTNAMLGGTVENEEYSVLPLNMNGAQRDVTAFSYLVPGVQFQSGVSAGEVNGSGSSNVNEIYVEGLQLTTITQGDPRAMTAGFSVDSIDQFQVETGGYGAQYQGIGVSNFVMKSGTDKWHASAFEFFRNTALDTWGYFVPVAAGKKFKQPEHQNEYGATVGGPLIKNKLFLFGSYDAFRLTQGNQPAYFTIPTEAQRTGDFSAAGNPTIYDPATTTCGSNSCTRTQFSYKSVPNVMDPTRIDPVAKFLLSFLPPTSNTALSNNYLGIASTLSNNWSVNGKLDYTINDKHRVSLLVASSRDAGTQVQTSYVPIPYATQQTFIPMTKTVIFSDSYVITPQLVNQLKYGFRRYNDPIINPTTGSSVYGLETGGKMTGLPVGQVSTAFPTVTFSGPNAPTQFSGKQSYKDTQNTYSFADSVEWTHGKHAISGGGQLEWVQDNTTPDSTGTAPLTLAFANSQTGGFKSASSTLDTTTGSPTASLFLGAPNSATLAQYGVQEYGSRYRLFSLYGTDDYRVNSKLTVNLGLRWDIYYPYNETQNRASFLNPTAINPAVNYPGALQFAGNGTDGCNCSTPIQTYYKNIGPRLGIAYSVTPKTVVRLSYGLLFSHRTGTLGTTGYSASINPISQSVGAPAFYLGSGFPAYQPPPFINAGYGAAFSTAISTSATAVNYYDPYVGSRAPYQDSWNAGVERQLNSNTVITVSYVGTQSHFVTASALRGYYSDQLNPKYYALAGLLTQKATPANVAAANAIYPDIALPYPTFSGTIGQMLLPLPQYSGSTDSYGNVGNANYNALQLYLKHRMDNGLAYTVAYTYAKEIDDVGASGAGARSGYLSNRIERTVGASNAPQILKVTTVYDLPGKKLSNRLLRNAASDWTVSGIFSYQSGTPLSITSSACNTPSAGTCYPMLNPSFSGPARINGSWGAGYVAKASVEPTYINKAAFVDAAAYTFGNTPPRAPLKLYNPNAYDIDANIRRTIPLFREIKMTIEADAFNLFNNVVFGGIGTNIDLSNFGQISTQTNKQRDIQLAARIRF